MSLLALGILGVGIVGTVSPRAVLRVWGRWRGPRRQMLHALARIGFGLAVAAVAPRTRAPEAVYWLGIVCFASGVLGLLMRPATFWALVSWGLRQSSSVIRLESALAAAAGGFLVWATLG